MTNSMKVLAFRGAQIQRLGDMKFELEKQAKEFQEIHEKSLIEPANNLTIKEYIKLQELRGLILNQIEQIKAQIKSLEPLDVQWK